MPLSRIVLHKSLANLYKCLVHPILEYACMTFDTIDNMKAKMIEDVQIQAATVCTGSLMTNY